MTVALILITHDTLGRQLVNTARTTLGQELPAVTDIAVPPDGDPEQLLQQGRRLCATLDQGDGVLVLTDLYGSTPGNLSRRLGRREKVHVVFGLNLAMLIKVLNYRHLPLAELSQKAVEGGLAGIKRYPLSND